MHFQRAGLVGYQRDQIHAWHNLDVLVDQLKLALARPLHVYDFRWRAAVIPLFRRRDGSFAIPRTAGLVVAVDSGPLLRRIDLHGGVHLEQIGSPPIRQQCSNFEHKLKAAASTPQKLDFVLCPTHGPIWADWPICSR